MRGKGHLQDMARAELLLSIICIFVSIMISPCGAQETDHIGRLSHIGIAVKDIEKSVADIRKVLALPPIDIEDVKERKVKVAFVEFEGVEVEFMQDYSEDGAMAKAVRERGDHINHFCLKTKDIVADIAILKKRGVQWKDEKPRVGLTKKWVAYTKEGTIGGLALELLQPYPEPPNK